MRWGRQNRRRWLVAALMGLVPTLAVPAVAFDAPTATESAVGPAVYDVQVNQRLHNAYREDGSQIRATSLRFYPEVVNVHRGAVIRFWGEIFLTPVVLLPPPWKPTSSGGHAWLAPEANIAHDLDDPWYFVEYDPDETPPDQPRASTKVNRRVIDSPRCGAARVTPCVFPQNVIRADSSPVEKDLDPITGALGSGIRPVGLPTELYVMIDAAPGTTIYATMLSVIGQTFTINVVDPLEPATDPLSLVLARPAQIEADERKAEEIDAKYRNYSHRERLRRGVIRWHAYAGVEEDKISVLESYPKKLRIRPGDVVRWHSAQLPAQFHTVSMPLALAEKKRLYDFMCDPDGDTPAGEPQPDQPTVVPDQPVCPGGPSQLEIDLNDEVVHRSGDGIYDGTDTDFETSGIVGAAPAPAPGFAPYDLKFPVRSGEAGFTYTCLLHPVMKAQVIVT